MQNLDGHIRSTTKRKPCPMDRTGQLLVKEWILLTKRMPLLVNNCKQDSCRRKHYLRGQQKARI